MMNTNIALPSVAEELPKLIADEEKQNGKEILKANEVKRIVRKSVSAKKNTDFLYIQLIPEKIYDQLEFIETEIKSFIRAYSRSRLQQIISIIAFHLQKDDDRPAMEPRASLNMTYLRKQVPQAEDYIKELSGLKIIGCDKFAIAKEKNFDYWFTPAWDSKFIEVQLKDMKLINRLNDLLIAKTKENISSTWGHAPQVRYLSQLTIDSTFYAYMKYGWSGTMQGYNVRMASARRIDNKIFRAKIDTTAGRFHSNVTFMAKDVREFLRVNGKPLVNIDIKNSQPYLSILLLTTPAKVIKYAKSKNLKSILKSLRIPKSKVIKLYIDWVVSGRFYENLRDEFAKEGLILDTDPKVFRDKTKKQVYKILFGPNWQPKDETDRRARLIFIKRFKAVHDLFSKIRGSDQGDEFERYSRFAILLQTIESHLVLDVIMKRIYKEMPGVFALSIHDSILTIDDRQIVASIENMMAEELEKFTGFRPILKID